MGYSRLWSEVELILAGSPTLRSFGLKGGVIILIWPQRLGIGYPTGSRALAFKDKGAGRECVF